MEGQAEAKKRVEARREERRRASLHPEMLKVLKSTVVFVVLADNEKFKESAVTDTLKNLRAVITTAEKEQGQ